MERWYDLSEDGDGLRVTFSPSPNRYWAPRVLEQTPIDGGVTAGRRVILTGSGAVWMYAYAAALFQAAGAGSIAIEKPNSGGGVDDLEGCSCDLHVPQGQSGRCALLMIHLRSSPPCAPGAIDRVLDPRLKELARMAPQTLVLGGRAAVEAYAKAARVAAASGVSRLVCWSARDGLTVVFDRETGLLGGPIAWPDWLAQVVPRPERSTILGVVGDPNRGKSVFSAALDRYRATRGVYGWKLDCDGQSPTPPWYLSRPEDRATHQLRQDQKRSWTPEMEARIAEQLRTGRELFPVLIADLPGGNHAVDPPQRVPEGRERLFAEIDRLVVLVGEADRSESAWRAALRSHGLEDRIACVMTSRDPKGPPSLKAWQDGPLWRGEVTGLDRSRSEESLDMALGPGFDTFWTAIEID